MKVYGNTSLNADEYGELFSPYSVLFHPVHASFFLEIRLVCLLHKDLQSLLSA